ncbi:MAG: tetratricopeptide repeat protein [Bdellovibrionales bacterium]|nr:tetratricopeptide repeat protein [Bdellovibrionales bacterium]
MKKLIFILGLISLLMTGCSTEPGETTGMGAATGGAIGAGLGALIGSSSGDLGSGLLVGAIAGAATGTVAGNYLEAQEDLVDHQDKVIARNANQLQHTRGELRDLRNYNEDQARFSGDFSDTRNQGFSQASPPQPVPQFPQENMIKESTIVNPTSINPYLNQQQPNMFKQPQSVRVNLGETVNPPQAVNTVQVVARSVPPLQNQATNECQEAEMEISKIKSETETADRLFHYRRALRLCPDNSKFHNALGEIYLSLGRKADAEFEFKESLRLNPEDLSAQKNLSTLTLNG